MQRIAVLAAMTGALILVAAIGGPGPLPTPRPAEAINTTWTWPTVPNAYTVNGGQALEASEQIFTLPCTNCWITRVEPDVIYRGDSANPDGASANFNQSNTQHGLWNHHYVLVDLCNASRVISAGNERSVLQYPPGYGYFQAPGCTWLLNVHLHNSGINQRKVAIKLNITYQTTPLANATPLWLDVATAMDSEYSVPTGYSDTHTGDPGMHADYTMSIQGKLIGMGGHVHDYGISVSAFNTGAGDRPDDWICTSVAGYGTGSIYRPVGGLGTAGHPAAANAETLIPAFQQEGPPANRNHIQSMSPCTITDRMSIICIGDVIRLHTQYNNTSGFPVPDAMGIMVAYIATPPNVPDANSNGTWDGCDAADSDGDEFSDRNETGAGTQANDRCPDNAADNAWPADVNNDTISDISDITFLTADFGAAVPPEEARHNIAPDPLDAFVDITDISRMLGEFGGACTP